jgi:uncharacterized membrane protein
MHDPHYDFGPLQLLTVAFDGNRFKGEILPELQRLKREGVARVVDMIVVRKDEVGAVAVLTASDLEWEEATQFGAYVGMLVGFGAAGADGADRGAIAGAAELADGHLFRQEDLERLTEVVPNGMTIGVVLIEHVWALPLLHAIENADGFELRNEWVDADRLVGLGASSRSSRMQD